MSLTCALQVSKSFSVAVVTCCCAKNSVKYCILQFYTNDYTIIMLNIQNYGSSSEDEDDGDASVEKQHSNEALLTHLKPVDPNFSVAKNMQICSAPVIVPTTNDDTRMLLKAGQELMHNPKVDELYAPMYGPENPFQTQQMKANRNILSGYVEKAHISEFQFENQRRTFTSYGYAQDPSTEPTEGNDSIVCKYFN